MKYTVRQTFETLGDPSETTHNTRELAEAAAAGLRLEIAEMVAEMATPRVRSEPLGSLDESAAWLAAEGMAGVKYDEGGDRQAGSPATYGRSAGDFIAGLAVVVEPALCARITKIDSGDGFDMVDLEWSGDRTVTDFNIDALGSPFRWGGNTASGWVVLEGRCRMKLGEEIEGA